MAVRGQCRMDEGLAQRQVRRRLHHPSPESLRDTGTGLRVQWRRHDNSRRRGGEQLQSVRVVPSRAAFIENVSSDDAAARWRCIWRVSPEQRHAQRVPPEYVAEQQRRHLHPRPVEPDAEDHRIGGCAVGVLFVATPRGSWHRGIRLRHQPSSHLRRRSERRELRHRSREEPVHATARASLIVRLEDFVIRAGYSRNPQSNNPGRQQMVPSQSFPQTIVINEAAPNNVTAVGSLSEGSTIVQPADQSSGVLVLPRGAGVNTYQGRVRARQDLVVEHQRAEGAGCAYERHRRLRGESSEWHVAQPQRQLRHARRRRGEPAVLPARHQLGHEHLHGRRQGQVRLVAVEHEPPDERWRPVHRRVHIREDDRLVAKCQQYKPFPFPNMPN